MSPRFLLARYGFYAHIEDRRPSVLYRRFTRLERPLPPPVLCNCLADLDYLQLSQ